MGLMIIEWRIPLGSRVQKRFKCNYCTKGVLPGVPEKQLRVAEGRASSDDPALLLWMRILCCTWDPSRAPSHWTPNSKQQPGMYTNDKKFKTEVATGSDHLCNSWSPKGRTQEDFHVQARWSHSHWGRNDQDSDSSRTSQQCGSMEW
jgi:hypothetical protein